MIRAWTCKLKLRFQLLVQQVDKFTNNVIREILKWDQFLKLARKEIFDIALEPLRYFLKEIKIWLIKNKTRKLPLTIFIASPIHWSLYVTDLSIHHLSLYPSVCRRKKNINSHHWGNTDKRQSSSEIVQHSSFLSSFYKCQSSSVPAILDFGLWWWIWLQDDGSLFDGF